jgi:hypothetical protein
MRRGNFLRLVGLAPLAPLAAPLQKIASPKVVATVDEIVADYGGGWAFSAVTLSPRYAGPVTQSLVQAAWRQAETVCIVLYDKAGKVAQVIETGENPATKLARLQGFYDK